MQLLNDCEKHGPYIGIKCGGCAAGLPPESKPRQIIRYRCPSGHRSTGRTDNRGVYNVTVVCPRCGATAVREFG